MMQQNSPVAKKLSAGIALIVLLTLCLCVTSAALIYASVSTDENLFRTGKVQLDLNGGNPIIGEGDILFEPGVTVQKEFYLENIGTCDVYYKLYFENIYGDLANALEITILDGETVLYSGVMSEMTRDKMEAADPILALGEKKTLTMQFQFMEESGNSYQMKALAFDFCADAVQVKNNPDREFD